MGEQDTEAIVILKVSGVLVTLMLPDELVEEWSVASLPREALAGNRVAVQVENGNLLNTWRLPRVGRRQA